MSAVILSMTTKEAKDECMILKKRRMSAVILRVIKKEAKDDCRHPSHDYKRNEG